MSLGFSELASSFVDFEPWWKFVGVPGRKEEGSQSVLLSQGVSVPFISSDFGFG